MKKMKINKISMIKEKAQNPSNSRKKLMYFDTKQTRKKRKIVHFKANSMIWRNAVN